ncbi:Uncharacterized protein APZ42_032581 [Daphnia magna]|nr:Uncharacterized protein APZ42_032581 [Daphnia magna]
MKPSDVGPVAPTSPNRKCRHDERAKPTPQSSTDYDIPWRSYTDEERLHILTVLRRDVQLRHIELERIR